MAPPPLQLTYETGRDYGFENCAASCGDVDCVAALLEAEGVNVDGRCGEGFRSPLHHALRHGLSLIHI